MTSGADVDPIRQGDRGAAVEDVQRRLLVLGYDLGQSGVDGVFFGATLAAVRTFQSSRGLEEDGEVGPQTWATLVDATFTLGDRLLYLRVPYFHGHDVGVLQSALNALGFSCGEPDGIFGAFTERAVREFQANVGQPADGIAGPETVRALMNLRHVWSDKDPRAPVALAVAPARAAEVLARSVVSLRCHGGLARDVGTRLANLAAASDPQAVITILGDGDPVPGEATVVVELTNGLPGAGSPTVAVSAAGKWLSVRVVAALLASGRAKELTVDLDGLDATDERSVQATAVGVLDGLCVALAWR